MLIIFLFLAKPVSTLYLQAWLLRFVGELQRNSFKETASKKLFCHSYSHEEIRGEFPRGQRFVQRCCTKLVPFAK